MSIRIQHRRGTAAEWASSSTVILGAGEIGFETDTGNFKIGNNVDTWADLEYFKSADKILGDVSASYDTLAEIEDAITAVNTLLNSGNPNEIFVTPSPDGTPVWTHVLTDIESLDFNTSSPGTSGLGKIAYNDTSGTLEFGLKGGNVTLPIGSGQVLRVRNQTGSTLAKGTVVYINGSNGTNFNVTKALADDDSTSAQTIGVLAEEMNTSSSQHGYVMTYGLISGVDLSYIAGLANGDMLFLDGTTAGRLTKTKPSSPTHLVYVGYCLSANGGGSNSTIFVKVQNGYELEELHNVTISSSANNDILVYDNATDPTKPVWKNKNTLSLSGNIASTAGSITASGNVTSTSGDVVASAGNVTASGNITASSATAITNTSTAHALQAGPTSGYNVRLGQDGTGSAIQAVNNGSYSTLDINNLGGNVTVGSSGATVDIVGTIANGNTIAAGTATAGTAQLKLTPASSGTFLTIPEAGAIESTADAIFATSNPGSTTTGPGRGIVLAPQMVFSQADSSGATSTTSVAIFASGNDVLSVLEPASTYVFKMLLYPQVTAWTTGGTIRLNLAFSNAPTAIKYNFKTYPTTAGTALNQVGTRTSQTNQAISATTTATGGFFTEIEGYFTTHATSTSTLTPQFNVSAGTQTVVMNAGSMMQLQKIGSSTATLIAGNWA